MSRQPYVKGEWGDAPGPEAGDGTRARELYKYFQPSPNHYLVASPGESPDAVLTAHAQLCALRLNCERAMISLIDRDTQYFVAEGTKTVDWGKYDDNREEDEENLLWAGCGNNEKRGRLCEYTLQAKTGNSPPHFEVLDLAKDDRFNHYPFIHGPPYLRYYCGVALKTRNDIKIGSLFVVDSRVQSRGISRQGLDFLITMAENIMRHFEMMREREDRKRAWAMSLCLTRFVDPSQRLKRRKVTRLYSTESVESRRSSAPTTFPLEEDSKKTARNTSKDTRKGSLDSHPTPSGSRQASRHASPAPPAPPSSSHEPRTQADDGAHVNAFRRASSILHEALSLEHGGGVVFLDTMTSVRQGFTDIATVSEPSSESEHDGEMRSRPERPRQEGVVTATSKNSWTSQIISSPVGQRHFDVGSTEILATTTTATPPPPTTAPGVRINQPEDNNFTAPSLTDLSLLIKRHPRGRLFTLDDDDASGSSGDEASRPKTGSRKRRQSMAREVETKVLTRCFPRARQIIFIPLWDAESSRWSVFMAYNNSEFRNFSHKQDFLYCVAFCNCLVTELGRLATLAADQQKGDFIGSISHELRSPLHGILASCELLDDTEISTFQRSLVNTADSCARTLLDTINMVLDYSKINSFERNWRNVRRTRAGRPTSPTHEIGKPALNIFGDVDLAALTEEVVEGVATGQGYRDVSRVDLTDMGGSSQREPSQTREGAPHVIDHSDVEIVLDIAPRDWSFVTQPGAFRRVVMNIFGNALKYTSKGLIKVQLDAEDIAPELLHGKTDVPTTNVLLTIMDTGKGISPEYLRSKLFTPFSQESSVAPGTGLGLSLVRSIVNMLEGEIDVKSALDVGTKVTVKLPMIQTTSSLQEVSPSGSGTLDRAKDDSIQVVREKAPRYNIAIFSEPAGIPGVSEATPAVRAALIRYLKTWYNVPVVSKWTTTSRSNIVIVDESDLNALLTELNSRNPILERPSIIAMCTNTFRNDSLTHQAESGTLEFVSKPLGPCKLAKALRLCIEQREGAQTAVPHIQPTTIEDIHSAVDRVTLSSPDADVKDISVLKQGETLGQADSINAHLALGSPKTERNSSPTMHPVEFPFPVTGPATSSAEHDPVPGQLQHPLQRPPASRKASYKKPPVPPSSDKTGSVADRQTSTASSTADSTSNTPATSASASASVANNSPPSMQQQGAASRNVRSPRVLMVDDNAINLRLLQTFAMKSNLTDVSSATDGSLAVNEFERLAKRGTPPDIVFMDITMPVMNGFEATQRIRAIEAELAYEADERAKASNPQEKAGEGAGMWEKARPSLIIALTGLASGRDQSEAFKSGVDLYMTKPVSLKEVGRVIKNWESGNSSNGSAGGSRTGSSEKVPHGAVTGAIAS